MFAGALEGLFQYGADYRGQCQNVTSPAIPGAGHAHPCEKQRQVQIHFTGLLDRAVDSQQFGACNFTGALID